MSTALYPRSNSLDHWQPEMEADHLDPAEEDTVVEETEDFSPQPASKTNEMSLVDFIRARENGLGLREAAEQFQTVVQQLETDGMNLYRRTLLDPSDAVARVHYPRESHHREMIMLASNNYLGLASHPLVIRAAQRAAEQYGTGSGSAPLLVGTFPITRQLESQLAELIDPRAANAACLEP